MGILFLTLFGLFSLLHLISSWKNDRIRRAKTKPFLISSLALAYLVSAEVPSALLLAALVTSWLGDVLLIPRGNRWVILGGISFLGSHVLLMVLFLPWTAFVVPFLGVWYVWFVGTFLIYEELDEAFSIEDQVWEAFPEQIPEYEV